jgi:hypothetical protein
VRVHVRPDELGVLPRILVVLNVVVLGQRHLVPAQIIVVPATAAVAASTSSRCYSRRCRSLLPLVVSEPLLVLVQLDLLLLLEQRVAQVEGLVNVGLERHE